MARPQPAQALEFTYRLVLEPDEEGGYVVTCPKLRGVVTQGETREEARAMAADAIQGFIELLHEDGLPIPPGDPVAADVKGEYVTVRLPAE